MKIFEEFWILWWADFSTGHENHENEDEIGPSSSSVVVPKTTFAR